MVELAKRFEPEIVAIVELKSWLGTQGAPVGDMPGLNKGGSVEADYGIRFTLTNAFHSAGSSAAISWVWVTRHLAAIVGVFAAPSNRDRGAPIPQLFNNNMSTWNDSSQTCV